MRRLRTGWLGLLLGATAVWPLGTHAATGGPSVQALSVQALLAEQDAELVSEVTAWTLDALELPKDMVLDPALRAALTASVRDLEGRLQQLVPAWIAEERAAANDPVLRGRPLSRALYHRSLNELLIGFVESTGPAHDEAWLKAATAPMACRIQYSAFYPRRIAIVQAAPPEVRSTLLAAEQALLARWGTVRSSLPPRPGAADMGAATEAVARLRAGLPVTAVPMPPFLAAKVFERSRAAGKPNRWERCATSQWWLRTQLSAAGADRAKALQVFRFSLLPEVEDTLSDDARADGAHPSDYPRAARIFEAEGTTTVRARLDDQGKVLNAEVIARKIRVPGIRGNRPLAYETLLDEAALDMMRRQSFGAAPSREVNVELVWKLEGDNRAAR